MIIYKRKIKKEDIGNLENEEKLIYYISDDAAVTIDKINDGYLIRKKDISENEVIDEIFLNTIDESMKFIETG